MGSVSLGDDDANLVILCVFSSFSYEVDSWGCVNFMCCLAGNFVGFFGFLLAFLGDFIENLQRYLCESFGLDFCWFFLGFYRF